MKNFTLWRRSPVRLILLSKFTILVLFSILTQGVVHAQTTPLSFTAIPYSDPDIISPRRGMEQWHGGNDVDPSIARPDVYYRFFWNKLETTQGNYDWSYLDGLFDTAIDHSQKISFGIMTFFPKESTTAQDSIDGIVEYGSGNSAYPLYLHNLMQSGTATERDWKTDGSGEISGYGSWVPNWNSTYYLARLLALNQAINNHLNTTSYKGVLYKNIVNSIDIRGFGTWGEWHSLFIVSDMDAYPTGRRPTAATLKTIIDHHVNAFPNFPLSLMMAVFDAEWLGFVWTSPEVTDYALSRTNNWGKLGWRRDAWGGTDAYVSSYLEDNDRNYNNGPEFKIAIMDRWKYAPVTGEPPGELVGTENGPCAYDDLERQVRLYHATSFGNGNYGGISTECQRNYIRAAEKAAGYRLILDGGSITTSISKGTPFALTLNWKNIGVTPTYENWNVVFELRNSSNTTVWSANSQFIPKLFLPSTTSTPVTDNLTIPTSVADGNYTLYMIVKEDIGYRKPLPLAITGRHTDGSYTIANITLSSSGTPATLNGSVTLQGRPAAPNAQWVVPLTVELSSSSSSSVSTYNVTTNQSGQFTISNITPGTYNIGVKDPHTLRTVKLNQALVAGSNSVSIGTLLAGDGNQDNVINWADVDIIKASYNKVQGDPGYDAQGDMNNDGYVSLADISVLAGHFYAISEYITPGCAATTGSISAGSTCDAANVTITLTSATGSSPFDLRIDNDIYSNTYTNVAVNGTVSYALPVQKMWNSSVSVTPNEDNPVELGVKFQANVDGYIKGVRFFSPNNISGVYTGHLWSSTGTLLASATFSSVTASGWQEVLFSAPVFISGQTIYYASYHTAGGRYSSTTGGLSDDKFNNQNIYFYNGVYAYGSSPVFPSVASGGNNYWADVLFTPASHTLKLLSVIGDNGCNNTRLFQTVVVNSPQCNQGRSVYPPVVEGGELNTFTNRLGQNIPNPSVSITMISYSIAEAANVNLSLYDVNGKAVKVLVNETKQAGNYNVSLNTGSLARGVYFYRIQAGKFSAVKKMIIE